MRTRLLCLLVLCPALSAAQDGRKVACRFLCVEGADPPPPLVNVSANGAEISCKIAPTLSEASVLFAKGDSISFLSSDHLAPAATATIPANMKSAILVFAPAEKAPLPFRVSVVEDFGADFPDGGALVANLCSHEIRFSIADATVTLQSGKTHRFARPEERDAFNMAPVVFQFQQDGTWRTASESALRFVPGMRYLILAFPDPASARPRLSTYQDFPTPKVPLRK